jgi:hypothetical protein
MKVRRVVGFEDLSSNLAIITSLFDSFVRVDPSGDYFPPYSLERRRLDDNGENNVGHSGKSPYFQLFQRSKGLLALSLIPAFAVKPSRSRKSRGG